MHNVSYLIKPPVLAPMSMATEKDAAIAVGALLQEDRLMKNASVAHLARHLGISKKYVRQIEQGEVFLDDKVLIKKLLAFAPSLKRYEMYLLYKEGLTEQPEEEEDAFVPEEPTRLELPEPPVHYESFGQALRSLRVESGFTQEELGKLISVTGVAVGFWEDGSNTPVQVHYDRLIDLFPDLRSAPTPDSRDLDPPIGQANNPSPRSGPKDITMSNSMRVAPPPQVPPSSTPLPRPALPPAENPNGRRSDLLEWTRLVIEMKNHVAAKDFVRLLEVADRNGLTLQDVLGLLL